MTMLTQKLLVGACAIGVALAAVARPSLAGESLTGLTPSPDGSRLAFASVEETRCVLHVLDLSSQRVVQRHQLPGWRAEAYYGMSWAPDGSWLAVTVLERTGPFPLGYCVWRVVLPSGKGRRLAGVPRGSFQRPRISPQADSLVFWDARRKDLLVLRLAQEKPEYITQTGDVFRLAFDWSPDGSQVYFGRGGPSESASGIWTWHTDGTKQAAGRLRRTQA